MLTVQKINNYSYNQKAPKTRNEPNFTARLKDLQYICEHPEFPKNVNKSDMILFESLTNFVEKIQEKIIGLNSKFNLKLGEQNQIPAEMLEIDVNGTTLDNLNNFLNSDAGKNGKQIQTILKTFCVREPNVITIEDTYFKNRLN